MMHGRQAALVEHIPLDQLRNALDEIHAAAAEACSVVPPRAPVISPEVCACVCIWGKGAAGCRKAVWLFCTACDVAVSRAIVAEGWLKLQSVPAQLPRMMSQVCLTDIPPCGSMPAFA